MTKTRPLLITVLFAGLVFVFGSHLVRSFDSESQEERLFGLTLRLCKSENTVKSAGNGTIEHEGQGRSHEGDPDHDEDYDET